MSGALDLVAQALVHGIVAAVAAEAIVRRVPIAAPGDRFSYRLAVLALPVVIGPVLSLVAPWRATDQFNDLALFSSARWQLLRVGGFGLRDLVLVAAALLGAWLIGHDVWRAAMHWWHDHRAARERRERSSPQVRAITDLVDELAHSYGVNPPDVVTLSGPAAILHCRGALRPSIVIAATVVDRLTAEQLRGALAHELSHVARRDCLRNYLLAVLRALQWFNPVAQVVARRAAQELEWRADADAAALTGKPLALARALIACVRGRDSEFLGLLGRGRIAALERRCRLLLDGTPARGAHGRWWDVGLVGVGLASLLVFVT